MANPRKFSEKIALHTQKQAEETAAFEAIIREVTATTRHAASGSKQQPQQQQQMPAQQLHLHLSQPNLNGTNRGRSLPNVNQISNGSGIDLQDALSSLENMKQAVNSGQVISERPLRDRSPQSQKKYILDRHRDCSPYGSVYLCPPSDVNWRRACSDSALHTSVMATTTAQTLPGTGSMLLTNGQTIENGQFVFNSGVVGMDFSQSLESKTMSDLLRPKSCDVPGINIFPSPESAGTVASGVVHVPIPNSTGSLPNLTNLSFSLPLSMPIDIDPVCCGPGGISPNYTVAESRCSNVSGTMPLRLHRHAVPVPLVLHSTGQFVFSGNGPSGEGKLVTSNIGARSSVSPGDAGELLSSDPPSYSNHIRNNHLRGSLSPPLIVITPVERVQRSRGGRCSEPLSDYTDCFEDEAMDCNGLVTNRSSTNNYRIRGGGRSYTPPPVFRDQNGRVSRPRSFDNRRSEVVEDVTLVGAEDGIVGPHRDESMTQYTMVNHCGSAADANHSPISSPHDASPHYSTPMEGCASAHVLYTVARDSSVASPGSTSDMSPGSVPIHFNSTNTMSPQWFSHSQSPPSSWQRDGSAASGELSPAHASLLQQRFQQINMVPEDQLVARHGGASGGVGLYSFTAQPVHLQHHQRTIPSSPLQHHQTIAVPSGQQLIASAGLVLVPASQQTNAAGTPFVWQVTPSTFSPTSCSQMSLSPAENPAFFRVATGGLPNTLKTTSHQGVSFNSSFPVATSPQIGATAIHFVSDFGQRSQEPSLPEQSSIPASSSIPDIVLTAEDLPVYSNQPLADCISSLDNLMQQDLSYSDGINALSYLGDSFDGNTDLFTAEDALKLGLDPLEIEELQMLAGASIIADPATEDSFRLERQ